MLGLISLLTTTAHSAPRSRLPTVRPPTHHRDAIDAASGNDDTISLGAGEYNDAFDFSGSP